MYLVSNSIIDLAIVGRRKVLEVRVTFICEAQILIVITGSYHCCQISRVETVSGLIRKRNPRVVGSHLYRWRRHHLVILGVWRTRRLRTSPRQPRQKGARGLLVSSIGVVVQPKN